MKRAAILAAMSLTLVAAAPAPVRAARANAGSGARSQQHKRVIQVPMKVVYAKLLTTVDPIYPPEAKAKGIQGTVTLSGMIGVDGRAHRLKLVSGPRALAGAAEAAVRQWTFSPATFDGKRRAVPWKFHLRFRPAENREPPRKIALSRRSMTRQLIRRVAPVYPPEAERKGIHGDVVLRVVVGKDGRVKSLERVSGNPILAKAAIAAVRQWVYEPTRIHGEPVEVHLTVTVAFSAPKRN